jgi:hypothetical protein
LERKQNNMLPMFWFTGVVEDREDPMQMGRVRVRIFGLHTDDTTKISTMDLPWANVMMPVNSASISGVGITPTGLVEGSWVVGFFADGENAQDPIIMGSLPSKSTQSLSELKAFKDPNSNYPRWFNETDVSRNARFDTWKNTPAYATRYSSLVSGVETATPPKLDTTQLDKSDAYYERQTWSEPEPRNGIGGYYPFVHTYESESGIVREYDDTPSQTRIHEYHPSGSFYEIYPDGKRSFKVVGDNFEVVIGAENILVRGNRTITIEGDAKQLVKGDYTLEVGGNYNLKVHGERNTKVGFNDNLEIVGNSNTNVKENHIYRVGKDQTLLVDNNKTESIGGTSTLTCTGAADYTFLDTYTMFSAGAQAISTNSSQRFLSKSGLEFGSDSNWNLTCNANMTITTVGNFNIETGGNFAAHSVGSSSVTSDTTSTITSTGTFAINASRIDLN